MVRSDARTRWDLETRTSGNALRGVRLLDATFEIAHELWPEWPTLDNDSETLGSNWPKEPKSCRTILTSLAIVQISSIYTRHVNTLPHNWQPRPTPSRTLRSSHSSQRVDLAESASPAATPSIHKRRFRIRGRCLFQTLPLATSPSLASTLLPDWPETICSDRQTGELTRNTIRTSHHRLNLSILAWHTKELLDAAQLLQNKSLDKTSALGRKQSYRSIAIINQKGGVGKTTHCRQLGCCLGKLWPKGLHHRSRPASSRLVTSRHLRTRHLRSPFTIFCAATATARRSQNGRHQSVCRTSQYRFGRR